MDRRRAGALLALAACIACSAAAPTASNHTALDLYDGTPEGCYYNFQHYGEGDRIMTNEPCLNCTCHNRMLMCYLRVCPFTKPIGQDCTIEKRADQCCPIVTCPDVPVDLLTSTSTTSPAEYGATGLGKLDKYGCSISGKYFPEGSKVPPTPNKPCEHCYCIRNMTTCVMQECTLHVDGCTPIYHKDVCCPVRYSCDHPEDEMPLLDDMSTTVRPTPGFLLTTTTLSPVTQMTQDCVHDDKVFADGAQIKTEKACEHCYCMKGDIVCVVQECGTPMENEGKNCTSLPPREGQCCPDTYICEGDELGTELPMDLTTESVPDSPTTLLPPRRTSVEGSGYRNEPDEVPYINIPTIQPEHEGSGEEQETSAPYDASEKLSSEKPVDIDDFITATKEDQYASYTTKSPSFEISEDTTANEISGGLEPQEYIPVTTNVPVETGYEINTTEENVIQQEVTEKEYLSPYEPTSDTLASEMYDKITTEPGEALNTVPDAIPGEEDIEQHKHIPSPTVASAEENEKTTPLITDEEIATSGYSDEKTIKPEHSFPSPSTIVAETSDATKEHDLTTVDSITEKEAEAEHYVPSTPSTSTISEIKTVTPELHEKVTSVDIGKETDGTEPNAYASSTISIPTEKGDEATSEPDHDQNTVGVVDEDNIYHHLHTTTTRITLEEEAGTTLHSIELGSGTEDFTEENILEPYEHVAPVSPSEEESIKTTSEPDRGLNTIPSEIVGESSSEVPVPEKTTISQETIVTDSDSMRRTDSKPTIASESSTIPSESTASRADHFTVTTEPSFRKDDESSITTEKSKESEVTTGKIDFSDEGFIPTSSHDEKLSTGANIPSIEQEFTTSTLDNEVETKAPATESTLVSSISSTSIPEKLPELPSEQGTEFIFETPTTEKVSELTTLAAEIEVHEEPGRIPGEGDCLLNGITYRNNSVVPSTNNCHSGCKCVSSIVKCDPIICSPPPDYMDNCQSIYDSPDSCCPTYVCDHPRETVPPQSDNQMSGTESPQPSPTYECRGDQCEINISTKQPVESNDKPESHECGPEGCTVIAQKPGDSKYPLEYPGACKDGKCPSPAGDCSDGKCEVPPTHELVCDPEHGCQAVPVRPCDGENCETTSVETAKPPHLCENKENCKDVTPCEGDSCKFEVSSPQDTQQVSCKEDGCKSEQVTPQECSEESCKKNKISEVGNKLPSECKGSQCVQQTETVPKEGPQDVYTESSVQEQTPFEVITDKAETNEEEHKITESQKEAELTITEQPHIVGVQPEISTVIPEIFTVSHEIVSESESPVGSNEIYTNTPEERRTTPSESYGTESDKSPQTTEKAIGTDSYTNEIPESQTTKPIEAIASADKDLSQTTDHITIPENIDHRYTTVSSIETAEMTTPNIAQSEITKLPEFSSEITTVAHELGTQPTLSSLMHESSINPESDVEAEKATVTSVTTESVQLISKSTEPTTEEEYGFTDNPEYEFPGTKTQDIEPIQIEPQDGTTESQKSPTGVQESTTRPSTISEYITEKEQIGTKLPIEVPKVTEFVSDEKQTESPEQSDGKLEQPITRLPVDIISSEDTDASPVIKEHMTDIPLPFTNEPETSFTEIEDSFVTGQDQTTTEKSIPDATISLEHFDKSTQVIEPFTTEKVHDIVEMSLPSSEKPLHPDSLSVGVTELQEISTKATEQEVTDKQQDIESPEQKPSSEVPPAQETSDIELPKSEKPDTEEKYQSTSTSVTEKSTSETSEHLSTNSQESITKQPHQYEETTELSKSPITESQETFTESPIVITTASKESIEPIVVTGHEEKTTYAPETEDIQVHLSTKSPEIFVTQQETGTELPHKEYSKVPGSYITESYETETQDLSTKMGEPELFKTTTEIPRTSDIKEVSTDEPVTELQKLHTESDIQKQSTDSSVAIEGMRTELPISQITTKQDESFVTDQQEYIGTTPSAPVTTKDATIVPGFTQAPEATLSEGEVQTAQPIHHVPGQVDTITETPEDTKQEEMELTIQEHKVTEAPEESKTEVTRRKEDSTKAPQDIKESEPQVTILEEAEVNKAPEDVITLEPDVSGQPEETPLEVTSQEEAITKEPEITKESEDVTSQEKEITLAPDDTEESLPEITKHEEEVTKSPEDKKVSLPEMTKQDEDVTRVPEDIRESLPESTEQEEAVTKGPEGIKETRPQITSEKEAVTKTPEDVKESLPEITTQEEKVTKAPEDTKESLPEITGLEKEETKSPGDVKDSVTEITNQGEEVTKAPEDTKDSVQEITSQEEEVTKVPEDMKESVPEITGHGEDITKAPEDTKVSLPEITSQGEEVTKAPEDTKESMPNVTGQEEGVTNAPEDTKESVPEITSQGEEVTKAPEDTKESVPEITSQGEEVTKAPEDMKESVPEITGQGEEVTKAPEDTKESVPEITSQGEEVTKAPEDTKESVPEITGQREDVTKAPEDTKASVPEITSQEEEVTKAPEDTKESVPEITGQGEDVTKAPGDMKDSVPEITSQEEDVTKAPEDTKASVPEITSQGEEVTKVPEDTKESVPKITVQGEDVTKAPEDTKDSVQEITSQEEEVTKVPEDTKESVPEITGQGEDITKAPEDTKESLPEITSQGEEVTKAPEDTKESMANFTGQEEGVTNAPEVTKESVPEITSQGEEVTKAPEDTKDFVPEITSQGEEVTKAPADTKESVPNVTGQGEGVTNAPEDKKEFVPEITSQGEEVTKAPEDTKDSVTEITSQGEEVTKAPEDMIESVPEITGQGEDVTKAAEDTKDSEPEITSQGEDVAKAPEDTKESLPEITDQGEVVTKAPEDTKESVPEITGQGDDEAKAPEDTKESVPEITSQGEEVTKAPEDTKESVPEITGQGEDVTKAPEDTKESVPQITGQGEEVTYVPEGTQESVPETTSQGEEVTKAPEDTKESVPEITAQGEDVTKAPEGTQESVPEITHQGEEVTKAPEDTKDTVPEITSQEEEVTKAPQDTKDSVPQITSQGEEVTKVPEGTQESVPETTSQGEEVTKAPEDTKESVHESTSQGEEVTKEPEGMKDFVPEITIQGEEVTKAPEDTKESVPEITSQGEEVTKAPEDTKDFGPEITIQGEEVTKAPEDTKESVPEITSQGEEVTKAPEDTKDFVPEITSQGEEVTKAPEDTKESVPEMTSQGEEITKAPEGTKESVPEISSQGDEVTTAPEDTKYQESLPEVTSEEEKVTRIPERVKESESEVSELSPGDLVTEKLETTPTLLEIHVPHDVFSDSDNKVPEDTTYKQVEEIATEQPIDQFSATTPDVIILEEHTHKIMEESSTPTHEERTTLYLDTVSEVTSQKPTEESIETVTKEVETPTKAEEGVFTLAGSTQPPTSLPALDQITEKVPEGSLQPEETPSDHKVDEVIKEREPTLAPALEETTPSVHIDSEKSPTPDTKYPVQTEKIPPATEKPVHHEIVHETTVAELIKSTTKATTTKQEEATVMPDDKLTKPGQKPVETSDVTPSAPLPELPKPVPGETQPTDELPTPEEDGHFPPSGMTGYGEPDYVEEDQAFGPGTCRYGGKVYVSAQQIPRDDPCDFCFCFRSDIICLQQSCPPPIHGCHEEPIQGFCCPRYECHVSMATTINMTTTTTTTTTTLPPHFPTHSYKGAAQRRGCQIKGHTYKVGEVVRSSSGPCLHCTCGGDGQMKCDPKACTPEPMLRQMIAAAVSAKRRR